MGLAERFREKLQNNDIYSVEQDIKQATTPIKSLSENVNVTVVEKTPKFETIESEILNKINKTPYWNEYSTEKQERMLNSYLNARTKQGWSSSENNQSIINKIFDLLK